MARLTLQGLAVVCNTVAGMTDHARILIQNGAVNVLKRISSTSLNEEVITACKAALQNLSA